MAVITRRIRFKLQKHTGSLNSSFRRVYPLGWRAGCLQRGQRVDACREQAEHLGFGASWASSSQHNPVVWFYLFIYFVRVFVFIFRSVYM